MKEAFMVGRCIYDGFTLLVDPLVSRYTYDRIGLRELRLFPWDVCPDDAKSMYVAQLPSYMPRRREREGRLYESFFVIDKY